MCSKWNIEQLSELNSVRREVSTSLAPAKETGSFYVTKCEIMSYVTSEQFAQLLLQNGFSERTKLQYPDDHAQISAGHYDPDLHRRVFKYGKVFVIHFDQSNLRGVNGFFGFQSTALNIGQVKSILAYIKLPNHTKTAVQNRCRNILDLEKEYHRIKKIEETHLGMTDQKILEIFESISLPEPASS